MSRAAHSHSRVPQAPGSQSLGRPEARASIVMVWPSAFAMTHLLPALGPSGPAAASGGYQHPWLGFPPKCSLTVVNSCAPSYAELAANDELWPCPAGRKPTPRPGENGSSSWPVGRCVPGAGAGGAAGCTAAQLNQSHPCCCAADGCWAQPRFNTVIGVCRGNSCACGGAGTTAPSCQPEGFPDSCGKTPWNAPDPASRSRNCTGSSVPCCHTADVSRLVPFYDIGSRAVLNYWAAYSWDPQAKLWRAQPQSSFNANGSRPPFDLMQRFGGLSEAEAWLAPQPGGSADWGLGYYPAGAPGVGGQPASGDDDSGGGGGGGGSRGGAAMFVLSTEEFFGATWYMLNQLELDRGPKVKMPVDRCETTNNNCWAAGNAGEMDFLEPGMSKGTISRMVRPGDRKSVLTEIYLYISEIEFPYTDDAEQVGPMMWPFDLVTRHRGARRTTAWGDSSPGASTQAGGHLVTTCSPRLRPTPSRWSTSPSSTAWATGCTGCLPTEPTRSGRASTERPSRKRCKQLPPSVQRR
jgi:hypothetical protein